MHKTSTQPQRLRVLFAKLTVRTNVNRIDSMKVVAVKIRDETAASDSVSEIAC